MNIFKNILTTAVLALLVMGNASVFAAEEAFDHQKAADEVARIALTTLQLELQNQTQVNNFLASKTAAEAQQFITSHIQQALLPLTNINLVPTTPEVLQALDQLADPFISIGNYVELKEMARQKKNEAQRLISIIDVTQVQGSEITQAIITQAGEVFLNLKSARLNMPHGALIKALMAPVKQFKQHVLQSPFNQTNNQNAQ
jgi:hypothetical protein